MVQTATTLSTPRRLSRGYHTLSRSIVTDRKKSAVHKHWSAKDRVKAVAAFLVLGNMARVEEQTGIPIGTLNYWKNQPWWFEQVEKIRQAEDQEIDNSFTKIVKKTQEIILDRLEHGDFFTTPAGTVGRKPVSMRDAAIAGAISVDKRKVLRDVPASEQNKIGMQERLKNLESQFTRLVTSKIIEGEVIDGTELQEGSGDRDPGEEGSPSGAEPSPDNHGEQGTSPQA
jgi:hypothetical protein